MKYKNMTLAEILAEYRKGCGNTIAAKEGPEHCPVCVTAFVRALEALDAREQCGQYTAKWPEGGNFPPIGNPKVHGPMTPIIGPDGSVVGQTVATVDPDKTVRIWSREITPNGWTPWVTAYTSPAAPAIPFSTYGIAVYDEDGNRVATPREIHNAAVNAAAKVCTDIASQYDHQNNQENALAGELTGAALAIRKLLKD